MRERVSGQNPTKRAHASPAPSCACPFLTFQLPNTTLLMISLALTFILKLFLRVISSIACSLSNLLILSCKVPRTDVELK